MTHLRPAVLAFVALALLGACGVDGGPTRPDPPQDDSRVPEPGISISGSVGVGVAGGSTSARVRR